MTTGKMPTDTHHVSIVPGYCQVPAWPVIHILNCSKQRVIYRLIAYILIVEWELSQALGLNQMTARRDYSYFIPVFAGDFISNLVIHAAISGEDFMLHSAVLTPVGEPSPGCNSELALRYMKYLLTLTRDASDGVSPSGRKFIRHCILQGTFFSFR